MLSVGCSLFLDLAVVVESLLSDKDFLGYQGEDWKIVRPDPVENCEVLSDVCGNKLACHRFMATGRGHTTPGSETKSSSLVTSNGSNQSISIYACSESVSRGRRKVGLRRTSELGELKSVALGSKAACPFVLEDTLETLSLHSEAVCSTNILEEVDQNEGNSWVAWVSSHLVSMNCLL